jgi:hypothetical protein
MMMDSEMFSIVLDTLKKIEREKLSLETRLEMDEKGDFPEELIRFMLGPDIGGKCFTDRTDIRGNGQDRYGHSYFVSGNLSGDGSNQGRRDRRAEEKIHPENRR